ncbi:MAG: hypothetical protein NVS1B13_20100 [Flavisolibacter sp.]
MISSWAYEKAKDNPNIDIMDNRAKDILCYDYRYTFVEKLQTIASKFRKEMNSGDVATNYMRQYYDVYSLLGNKEVQDFIGTEEYIQHKKKRFSAEDFALPIIENEAFQLNNTELRSKFQDRYEASKTLYYKGQTPFNDILVRIGEYVGKL